MTNEVEKLRHELHNLSLYGDWEEKLRIRIQMHKCFSREKNERERTFNLAHVAIWHRRVGNCGKAIQVARRASEMNAGKMNASEATSYMLLAMILTECRKFEQAVPIAERALSLFESTGHDKDFLAARRSDLERMKQKDTTLHLDW